MTNKVHAEHILVETHQEAMELKKKIDNGESFEELAKKHSKCPSGSKGGDLGWFGRQMMVKEFEDTSFKMEPGEVSNPFKTQFGWHLIKLIDKE
jgi:parvulin-like peptidyl-prolyl isomerase